MSHGWQPSGDGGGRGGGLDGFLTRLSNRRPQALGATSNSNAAGDNMGNHSYRPAPSYPPPAPFLQSLYAGQEDNISLDGFDRNLLSHSHSSIEQSGLAFAAPSQSPLFRPTPQHFSHNLHTQTHSGQFRTGPAFGFSPETIPSKSLEPSPATRNVLQSEQAAHRLPALQRGKQRQQLTPPMHSTTYNYHQPAELNHYSSNDLEDSSPAERANQRRQQSRNASEASRSSYGKSQGPSILDLPHAPPIAGGIRLISPHDVLSDKFQSVFPYDLFNAVQSKCFASGYESNDNMVVSAPTGSGKTAIMELAICKLAADRGDNGFKIVYQAPTKALCNERSRDWEKKFRHMNLEVAELTGDTSATEMRRVGSASIIVTTPEKWDSITRKWTDHRKLLKMVELFLIDEVHILKDTRGATLEAVVSRMKTIGTNVRFIALSATVPNSDDIAKWLGRDHGNQKLPARRETFGEELRPVKLRKYVYGFDNNGNDFIFDSILDNKLPVILSKHAARKPMLVFCFTRKSCETTAQKLAESWAVAPADDKAWPAPSKRIPVISRELQQMVGHGVAFHHAGLDAQDRNAVEQAFLGGDLHVICCTSTLAVGVNLPCHTVILKGTSGYQDGKLSEYSDLEVMQMLGRAGRPQFDDSATAIILTRNQNKDRYERMISGQQVLESTLHLNLIEHLNSEIGLQTIRDLPSAKAWLNGTFLSVRLRQNPEYYRLTKDTTHAEAIEDRLEEICVRDILLLQDAGLVTRDTVFAATEYGKGMAKYMVQFETMKKLLQIGRGVKMEGLLKSVSQAEEFRDLKFKPHEKALYRELNKSPFILYPIRETVMTTAHKISLLVQVHLGAVDIPTGKDYNSLRRQIVMEKTLVFERMQRLARCVADCKGHDCDAVGIRTALDLVRALASGSWEGKPTQLLQIPNIGPVAMRKLLSAGVLTVHQLAEKEYTDIERILSRNPPYGKKLHDTLTKFPALTLEAYNLGPSNDASTAHGHPSVNVKAVLSYSNTNGVPTWSPKSQCVTFTAESTSGTLAYFWRGSMKRLKRNGMDGFDLFFQVPLANYDDEIRCQVSCEEIVGTTVSKTLRHGLSESTFSTHSPVFDDVRGDVSSKAPGSVQDFDDGISDDALIEVAERLRHKPRKTTPALLAVFEDDDDDDEFPHVEEFLEVMTPKPSSRILSEEPRSNDQASLHEPVQLANGRWKCNHACSNGQLTKSGKPCTHRCCREGLDKPRKYKPLSKSKKGQTGRDGAEDAQDVLSPRGEHRESDQDHTRIHATKKHKRSTSAGTDQSIPAAPLPAKRKRWSGSGLTTTTIDGIDCIDLSNVDDIGSLSKGLDYQSIAKDPHPKRLKSPEDPPKSIKKRFTSIDASNEAEDYGSDPFDDLDLDNIGYLKSEKITPNAETENKDFARDKARDIASHPQMSPHATKKAIRDAAKLLDLTASFTSNEDLEVRALADAHTWKSRASWPLPREDDTTMFEEESEDVSASPSTAAPETPFETGRAGDNGPAQEQKTAGDPAWIGEFDEDFVNQFRGYVNFI